MDATPTSVSKLSQPEGCASPARGCGRGMDYAGIHVEWIAVLCEKHN